jgi:signal transduction histidine kinase
VKEISFRLSPHILQNFGLVEALKSYTNKLKETSSVRISLNADNVNRVDKDVETILYRVICECINNTVKHANATSVTITLSEKDGFLLVIYEDDGKGFNIDDSDSAHKGIGLMNMQSRIKSINGTMEIASRSGHGTRVKFQIKI